MPTLLVIDDNPSVGTALELLFSLHEIDVERAETPDAGLALLQRGGIDLVIQDMNFHADTTGGDEGVALFREIRDRHPDMPVILLTAWTRLESAVDLVKAGAADYIGKPWDDHKLLASVNNLLELVETRRELSARSAGERGRREAMARQHDLRGLVYDDLASETVLSLALQVARSELPVLVSGPNGTGKEKYAEIIHYNSAVKSGPFVAVNCGALPSELIEAELFGAEPGAYTGAGTRARGGRRGGGPRARPPTAAPCSWTRSAPCRRPDRSSCCAYSRPAVSSAWVGTRNAARRCAWSARPTPTWRR